MTDVPPGSKAPSGETISIIRAGIWIADHQQLVGAVLLGCLMAAIAAIRLYQFSGYPAPSGSDGGQWLAFASQLFGGEQVRSGIQSYPPIFPFLVKTISLHDGLLTLKLLGVLSSVAIAVPVYLILRTALAPLFAVVIALGAILSPYHAEVLSFGGYPQLLGTAFLLLSVFLILQGLKTGDKGWFLGAALATAGTVGSNILPSIMLVSAVTVSVLLWHYSQRGHDGLPFRSRLWMGCIWWAVPSVILSLAFLGSYWDYVAAAADTGGGQRDLSRLDIIDWLTHSWRWELALWTAVFSASGVVLVARFRRFVQEEPVLAIAALAMLVSGLGGIFVLGELRFGVYVEIGLVLVAGVLVKMLCSSLARRSTPERYLFVAMATVIIFVLVVGGVGMRRSEVARDWYQVLDNESMPAMAWLRENRVQGAKVVATEAERRNLYGWWIEGYARMPAFMVGDEGLFIGAEELDHVAYARRLLLDETDPEVIRSMAESQNIRFLFIDTRVVEYDPTRFAPAGFVPVFDKGSIVILGKG